MTTEETMAVLRKLTKKSRPDLIPNLELAGVDVKVRFRLEKFDGDPAPGKVPIEVIEGGDDRPTIVTTGD